MVPRGKLESLFSLHPALTLTRCYSLELHVPFSWSLFHSWQMWRKIGCCMLQSFSKFGCNILHCLQLESQKWNLHTLHRVVYQGLNYIAHVQGFLHFLLDTSNTIIIVIHWKGQGTGKLRFLIFLYILL